MQGHASVEIDRPIDEVFQLTNENVAEWSVIVVEDEVLERKPEGVGTRFRSVSEDHGRRMEMEGVVTRWEPPRESAVRLTGKMFDIDAEYAFEDLGGRTRVTQQTTVHPKGFLKIFFALFGWLMNKSSCQSAQKEMDSLKQFCEARAVAP